MASDENVRLRSRADAGKQLAEKLSAWRDRQPVVVAMTRGGVPLGAELARALQAPLHVIVARKITVPGNPNLAMGAVAEGGGIWVDRSLQEGSGVSDRQLQTIVTRVKGEVAAQVQQYRGGQPLPPLNGATAILVDDGLLTGATLMAAIDALKKLSPSAIIVAAGVGARPMVKSLKRDVYDVVCAVEPSRVSSLAHFYADFRPVSDQDVVAALESAQPDE